jgi:formamidopyrimidine-DNA glycosylase
MPELPDVEAYKKYMDSKALHQKIKEVEVQDKSILKTSPKTLQDKFTDQEFEKSTRIGKNLLVQSQNEHWLILHFGMTGYLEYYKKDKGAPKYSKVIFHFDNHHCLSFINKRKLGSVDITADVEGWRKDKKIGPDALDLDLAEFREIISRKKSRIKTALTDQSAIAGIGNIYADEILFQARIHPELSINDISDDQVKELYGKMKQVLETAIKHDAQPDDLPSHYLLHHRKEGNDCPKCGGKIEKITIAGRSSYVCPACQKAGG